MRFLDVIENYTYEGNIFLNKYNKGLVAKDMGLSVQRVSDTITDLVKKGILVRVSRCMYKVGSSAAYELKQKRDGLEIIAESMEGDALVQINFIIKRLDRLIAYLNNPSV